MAEEYIFETTDFSQALPSMFASGEVSGPILIAASVSLALGAVAFIAFSIYVVVGLIRTPTAKPVPAPAGETKPEEPAAVATSPKTVTNRKGKKSQ